MSFALPGRRAGFLSLSVLVALAIMVYTVTSNSGRANAQTQPAPKFTAVQLVNGILFQDGAVAARLAGHDNGGELNDAQRSLEKAIDDSVTQDGAWADGFTGRIQSGDRVRVEQALRDLGVLYRSVLDKRYGSSVVNKTLDSTVKALDDSATAADPYTANYQININYEVNYAAVDLAIEIAALIVVIIAAFLSPQAISGKATGAGARLSIETFVDRVATQLATV
ncbi:hypothetical protein [Micromonospora lupini]|uniref:hypothetical protein n=1 Tax=Micromonospora lupini TaxID=285679 RepID=UPI0031D3E1B9